MANQNVAIIDYGLSNLFNVRRAVSHVGAKADIVTTPDEIKQASILILPGVGAFADGMRHLRERGLIEPILEAVGSGKPLLGICLGMQLLFDSSEEFENTTGLGIIPGQVKKLEKQSVDGERLKIPHIGWRALQMEKSNIPWDQSILKGLQEGDSVYFVHSYIPFPSSSQVTAASINYGGHFYSTVVEQGRVAGCQFHPEKSGPVGLQILKNFITIQN